MPPVDSHNSSPSVVPFEADLLLALTGQRLETLVTKYNTSGPRYTSYPTVPQWTETFGAKDFSQALATSTMSSPLSLYTHLPFCAERCLFCGCNVVITQQSEQAEKYLGYLFQDIERVATAMEKAGQTRQVSQYHWGGGTPTYLNCEQMERLYRFHQEHFTFANDAEVAIEVDPRVTTNEQLTCLKELGFNRLSMGVQDFDPKVQETIHRIQPEAMTVALIEKGRELGFESINIDLIYGLPHQSEASFTKSLEAVLRLNPDRIALYNYAYVPWLSPHQKQIPEDTLPEPNEKLRIFKRALTTLLQAGYIYIGMDHFAKPTDELSVAMHEGRLHRNFMGYTVMDDDVELLGFGVSSISSLDSSYAQNQRKLMDYYRAIDDKSFAVFRGCLVTSDDKLHRAVINGILCQGKIDYSRFHQTYGIEFETTFKSQMQQLLPMVDDGLVEFDCAGFHLTPIGRILSRNVAMLFDAYLGQSHSESSTTQATSTPQYSRTV